MKTDELRKLLFLIFNFIFAWRQRTNAVQIAPISRRLETNLFAVARLLHSSIKVQLSEAALLCNDEVGTREQLSSGAVSVEQHSFPTAWVCFKSF